MTPTYPEWAWIAGLFEGEGTIVFNRKTSVTCAVQMVDRDVLERLQDLVPAAGGIKLARVARGGCKDQYAWVLSGRNRVRAFLQAIRPWLGTRRGNRADEALLRLAGNRGPRQARTHCPSGHPYEGVNLYITPKGHRQCVACRKARA